LGVLVNGGGGVPLSQTNSAEPRKIGLEIGVMP
jgi:hypothetical protein